MLDDVGAYLVTQLSLTLGTDLFLAHQPETVPGGTDNDNCVMLWESPAAREPWRVSGTGSAALAAVRPTLQVVCRDKSYAAARTQAEAVRDALSNPNPAINGYHDIWPEQEPFDLKKDEGPTSRVRRHYVACNYRVIKEP